jgi:competence protein ComEC
MRVHFYDVGEALAALVDLPDGRHILVDAGANPHRPGCDYICASENEHLLRRLSIQLGDAPIDVLWATDQSSEDLGGVPEVLEAFKVGVYVNNGRDLGKPDVRRAREAARTRAVSELVIDPEHRDMPMTGSPELRVRAIVPAVWPAACDSDPGECAIPLRIDYCASSVLFTGDVEQEEESVLDPAGAVTLLQVARHGSETATSPIFLAQAKPRYAVISAGRPEQASNRESCHPRAAIVERLTKELGGGSSGSLASFAGARCDRATERDWEEVPTTDRLWATERDGDIVLSTPGDGTFAREQGN